MKRKHYLLAVEKDGAVFYAQRNPDCLKGYRLVRDKAKAETFGEEIRKIWLKVYPSGSAEEVSGPIRPDRPAKAPRAPRAEKPVKAAPPKKLSRKDALGLIMVAGYEGDRARATRILIENRINKAAADEAFRRGAAKKAAEERKAASVSEPLELAPEPSRALELAPVPSGKTEIPWNEAQERDARADKKGAAIVLMDPDIFLELTTADAAQVRAIRDAAKPIDTYLSQEVQKKLFIPPFITIDPNRDNKIVSHEGRHRAAAVVNAGGKAFKVLIRTAEEGQDLPSSMRFQFVPGKEYPLKTLEKVGSLRVLENLAKQRKERAFSSYMAEKRQKTEELAERLKKFAPGSIAIQILTGRERVFRKENVLEDSWNEIRKSAEGWEPVPGGNIYEDVILRGYRTNPDAWEFIDSRDPMKGDLTVEYRRIGPMKPFVSPRELTEDEQARVFVDSLDEATRANLDRLFAQDLSAYNRQIAAQPNYPRSRRVRDAIENLLRPRASYVPLELRRDRGVGSPRDRFEDLMGYARGSSANISLPYMRTILEGLVREDPSFDRRARSLIETLQREIAGGAIVEKSYGPNPEFEKPADLSRLLPKLSQDSRYAIVYGDQPIPEGYIPVDKNWDPSSKTKEASRASLQVLSGSLPILTPGMTGARLRELTSEAADAAFQTSAFFSGAVPVRVYYRPVSERELSPFTSDDQKRKKFDELRKAYEQADKARSDLGSTIRFKYREEKYAPKSDQKKLSAAYDRVSKASSRFFDYLTAISPRDFSFGVSSTWVLEDLKFEDAIRPLNEDLSEVPEPAYGYKPEDMRRFARASSR